MWYALSVLGALAGLLFSNIYTEKANSICKVISLTLPRKSWYEKSNVTKVFSQNFLFTFIGSILGTALYTCIVALLPCVFVSTCAASIDYCLSNYDSKCQKVDQKTQW